MKHEYAETPRNSATRQSMAESLNDHGSMNRFFVRNLHNQRNCAFRNLILQRPPVIITVLIPIFHVKSRDSDENDSLVLTRNGFVRVKRCSFGNETSHERFLQFSDDSVSIQGNTDLLISRGTPFATWHERFVTFSNRLDFTLDSPVPSVSLQLFQPPSSTSYIFSSPHENSKLFSPVAGNPRFLWAGVTFIFGAKTRAAVFDRCNAFRRKKARRRRRPFERHDK